MTNNTDSTQTNPSSARARSILRTACTRAAATIAAGAALLITGVVLSPATDQGATAAAPTLAQMNATHNHALGSTIPRKTRTGIELMAASSPTGGVLGLDVSGWQPDINWAQVAADGATFAYVKATEGADYTSSQYQAQWDGAASVGIIRGAYHFAIPNQSSGADQARYFLTHGGTWTDDGRTLPPLLDIEYGPNDPCYGMSAQDIVTWVGEFAGTVAATIGRLPVIYTTTDWWANCAGNSPAVAELPLFIANYTDPAGPGTLPSGWAKQTIWQYSDSGVFPGDQDVFNGTLTDLQKFARNWKDDPTAIQPR